MHRSLYAASPLADRHSRPDTTRLRAWHCSLHELFSFAFSFSLDYICSCCVFVCAGLDERSDSCPVCKHSILEGTPPVLSLPFFNQPQNPLCCSSLCCCRLTSSSSRSSSSPLPLLPRRHRPLPLPRCLVLQFLMINHGQRTVTHSIAHARMIELSCCRKILIACAVRCCALEHKHPPLGSLVRRGVHIDHSL